MSKKEICVVVVGGGIAATSCIEALLHEFTTNSSNPTFSQIILVAPSRIVKRTANYELLGRNIEKFNVVETEVSQAIQIPSGLKFRFVEAFAEEIKFKEKRIIFQIDTELILLPYDILCLCLGASPRQPIVVEKSQDPLVRNRTVLIRDTNSIRELETKLSDSKKILIVGNGGIGLELVDKITDCDKVWLIRDDSIGLNFLDVGAAKFLLELSSEKTATVTRERGAFSSYQSGDELKVPGPSLGPHWLQNSKLKGSKYDCSNALEIIHQDQVELVEKSQEEQTYFLNVITQKGVRIECDLVIFGIGVVPNTDLLKNTELELAHEEGSGIVIDDQMRTSVEQVYAAGDVVSCKKWPKNDLWFQMRLWTQARSMGFYTGRCIAAHLSSQNPSIYFNFDCFTHCTSFFNYKVILIGRYNQEQQAHEVIVRVNRDKDYVKVLLNRNGRIFGALLVGESGLEETIENLIQDGIDVSSLKDKLLDDTVDIEDYFD